MTPLPLLTVLRSASPTDAELLDRFVRRRDPAAFELLVWRHQRLVWGVCRRVLRDAHEAEDAFQATFFALARKAAAISAAQALGGWLYQVAYRTACRARAEAQRRALRERTAARADVAPPIGGDLDLWPLLDAELQRLPGKVRAAVVLCYLEGKTYDEAARLLGCPKGTLSTRLTRARALLRSRLARRGLDLTAVALATAFGEQAAIATAPAPLVARTVQTVGTGGAVPARVAALTQGVLRAMFWIKMKPVLGATLLLTVLAAVAVVLPLAGRTSAQEHPKQGVADPSATPKQPQPQRGEPRAVIQMPDTASALAVSADGKLVAVAIADYAVCIWDVATRKELARIPLELGPIFALAFSPDGSMVVAAGALNRRAQPATGAAVVWEVSTRKVVAEIAHPGPPLIGAQFGPTGNSLTILQAGGTVRQMTLGVKETRVIDVAGLGKGPVVIGDANHIATNDGAGGTAELVYLQNGPAYRRFGGPAGTVTALALTADVKLLAAAYTSEEQPVRVRIFDSAAAKAPVEIVLPKLAVHSLSFSAGGSRLAAACGDGTVKVWDTASGKLIADLPAHKGRADFVRYAARGNVLVSCGQDKMLCVWDVADAAPPKEGRLVAGERLTALLDTLLKTKRTDDQIIEALTLATFARLPNEAEMKLMRTHVAGKQDRREAFADVLWALVNSLEFHANLEDLGKQDPRKQDPRQAK
jgi:RNA polymerase sigma factor (sigma-70 family)